MQDISHLPERKQVELQKIVKLIREHDRPEMIILFGSYARGDWVEELFEFDHLPPKDLKLTKANNIIPEVDRNIRVILIY